MQNDKKEKKDSIDGDDDIKLEKPSYTYWKRDSDKQADHTGFMPQPTNAPVPQTNPNKIGSAWNKAGTWEEKKLNKTQIEDFLNEYIKKNAKTYKDSFELNKFFSHSGDTYYVFSRGKIKFIYDCEIKVELKGVKELEGVKTEVTIKELSNADLDEDFEFEVETVTKKDNEKKYNLCAIFKTVTKEVQSDVRKMFDEMKEHYMK